MSDSKLGLRAPIYSVAATFRPALLRSTLALAIASVLCGIGLGGCTETPKTAEAARPVLVRKAAPVNAVDQDVYVGEVRARHEADLGFRIAGKIIARLVDVGDSVKKGDVLAHLDPADVRQQMESAQAQVAAAQTDLDYARAELARYQALFDQKFIGNAVLHVRKTAFDTARARLVQAQSQLELSKNQSSYAVLTADRDGVITATPAEVGQVVAAGDAVLRLAQPIEQEVVVNIPEARVVRVREGQDISIWLWADPTRAYHGKLREIAPNADPVTRTFTAKVSILDPGEAIRLGMTAKVLFSNAGERLVFELPLTSIYHAQDGKPAVWVVDPQTEEAQLRLVEIGQYRENDVILEKGLNAGDLVVVVGAYKLQAGQKVKPQMAELST